MFPVCMPPRRHSLALMGVASLVLAGPAGAAIVVDVTSDTAPAGGAVHDPYSPPFSPSDSDLLTSAAATLVNPDASLYTREAAGGVPALTDGSVDTVYPEGGPGGDDIDHAPYATLGEDELIIWDLGGLFNLTSAVVYGGWNDGGRDQTFFGLDVSTNGVDWTTVAVGEANLAGDTPISHRISINDDTDPFIATNVAFVRLDPGGVENGYTGYTEVDVFGEPVPEPTSLALLALGGLAVMRRRHA